MEVVPGGVCAMAGSACATKRAATIRAPADASNPEWPLLFVIGASSQLRCLQRSHGLHMAQPRSSSASDTASSWRPMYHDDDKAVTLEHRPDQVDPPVRAVTHGSISPS